MVTFLGILVGLVILVVIIVAVGKSQGDAEHERKRRETENVMNFLDESMKRAFKDK